MFIRFVDFSNFILRFRGSFDSYVKKNRVLYDCTCISAIRTLCKKSMYTNVLCLDGIPQSSSVLQSTYKGTRDFEESNIIVPSMVESALMYCYYASIHNITPLVCFKLGEEADQVISSLVHLTINNYSSFNDVFYNYTTDRRLRALLEYDTESVDHYISQWSDANLVIDSTDADFIQLQRYPQVFILDKGVVTKTKASKSTGYVSPSQSIIYKAVLGDKSDFVKPAIPSKHTNAVLSIIKDLSDEDVDLCIKSPVQEFTRLFKSYGINIQTSLRNLDITKLSYYGKPSLLKVNTSVLDKGKKLYEFYTT